MIDLGPVELYDMRANGASVCFSCKQAVDFVTCCVVVTLGITDYRTEKVVLSVCGGQHDRPSDTEISVTCSFDPMASCFHGSG